MTLVKEVVDGIKTVADAINDIKTIVEAVQEGKDYVKIQHPEVKKDLRAMVKELRKNLDVIAEASAVLTQFRFAASDDTGSAELARFNDYFIEQKGKARKLESSIEKLRTRCEVVRTHAANIGGSASQEGFAAIFRRLRLSSPAREKDLAQKLDKLAYSDFDVANSAKVMLKCLDRALREVQDTLGSGGQMFAENVPKAAAVLSAYAKAFEKLETPAEAAADQIEKVVRELE